MNLDCLRLSSVFFCLVSLLCTPLISQSNQLLSKQTLALMPLPEKGGSSIFLPERPVMDYHFAFDKAAPRDDIEGKYSTSVVAVAPGDTADLIEKINTLPEGSVLILSGDYHIDHTIVLRQRLQGDYHHSIPSHEELSFQPQYMVVSEGVIAAGALLRSKNDKPLCYGTYQSKTATLRFTASSSLILSDGSSLSAISLDLQKGRYPSLIMAQNNPDGQWIFSKALSEVAFINDLPVNELSDGDLFWLNAEPVDQEGGSGRATSSGGFITTCANVFRRYMSSAGQPNNLSGAGGGGRPPDDSKPFKKTLPKDYHAPIPKGGIAFTGRNLFTIWFGVQAVPFVLLGGFLAAGIFWGGVFSTYDYMKEKLSRSDESRHR